MLSKICEESAAANPEGKTMNILLVVDMQKDFVDQALGTPEAQASSRTLWPRSTNTRPAAI